MDNLSTHKVQGVEPLLQAKGVELRYLPPYSTDLNPIELAFAKLKTHLGQAAARNLKQLMSALANSLDTFLSRRLANFFSPCPICGYLNRNYANL